MAVMKTDDTEVIVDFDNAGRVILRFDREVKALRLTPHQASNIATSLMQYAMQYALPIQKSINKKAKRRSFLKAEQS